MGFDIVNVDGDKVTAITTADRRDVQTVADHCAALRSIGLTGTKDDKLAASVPGWVINDWCVKRGIAWAEFFRDRKVQERFLDDPDNAAFRVWQGKV